MSRVITVVLRIEDQGRAKEFWDAHLARRQVHGCAVVGLAEGDLMQKVDDLEDMVDDDQESLEII